MRAGQRGGGRHVAPRPGDQPRRGAGGAQAGVRPEGVVAVAVRPAGDDHGRGGDRAVVGPQRAVPPVGAVRLLLGPAQQPRFEGVEATPPLVAPAVAEHGRHRRQRVHRDHVRRVVDDVEQPPCAAHVVHVVGVAVVGGVDRHDRLEGGRAAHRDLDRVEAGVRRAEHADVARAPRLRGEPGDDRDEIVLLAFGVLVGRDALTGTGAAQVEPADRVAVLVAEPFVLGRVAGRDVVLAVGQRLQQARRRVAGRPVERRGQPYAVVHRDPHIFARHPSTLGLPDTAGQALTESSVSSGSCRRR